MDNLYFFLSSKDYVTSTYPYNKPTDFTCELTETHLLDGDYECSVVDFILRKKGNPSRILYLFCDICSNSYVNERQLPLVKVIDTKRKEVSPIIYIDVKASQFNRIRMYIKDSDFNIDSVAGITSFMCTLHLRKKKT